MAAHTHTPCPTAMGKVNMFAQYIITHQAILFDDGPEESPAPP